MKQNFCTTCGYLADTQKPLDKCPICGGDKRCLSSYDVKLEELVRRSVQGNLTYPDAPGTDWAHPNSSLSRHMRTAVFNAVTTGRNNRR